ncbi:hypothetical protein POM88_050303 [Heracleum sosnowskyi]|uniref:Uncharacterized protein n=1 Tax=Heracleum sosnowskyi TaxID=360622 RepID=A0AAD8M2F4_9APIA|nr:hypothetical protein POM88_050303 [Heracleum sosnowskyi]
MVVEVASGDCIVVATDLLAKRRIYLSSIRCPRLVNGKAREVLEKHLNWSSRMCMYHWNIIDLKTEIRYVAKQNRTYSDIPFLLEEEEVFWDKYDHFASILNSLQCL